MVVQLGLAMIPLGGRRASAGLTSETTSGTSGSIRQAEELSITIAPAAATLGAVAREAVLPLENRARSSPEKSAVSVSSTVISVPCQARVRPADRAEAKNRIVADRELPLRQQGPHDPADLPRRPEHSYTHGLQPKSSAVRWSHDFHPIRPEPVDRAVGLRPAQPGTGMLVR